MLGSWGCPKAEPQATQPACISRGWDIVQGTCPLFLVDVVHSRTIKNVLYVPGLGIMGMRSELTPASLHPQCGMRLSLGCSGA